MQEINQIRVSVIIVTFNAENYISECISALSRQSYKPSSVIIVDNNSQDNTRNLLLDLPQWIKVLPLRCNTGFAAANNIAMSLLRDTSHIVLLNPDTRPDQYWLEKLVSQLSVYPRGDSFTSLLLDLHNPELIDGAGDVYHVSGLYWRRLHGAPAQNFSDQCSEVFSCCGAAALYDLDTIKQLGGFNEAYFCYSEDIDLGFRLRSRGHRAWLISDSVVYHAGSGITGKHSEFSLYYGHRNLVWTYVVNMPGWYLWKYLPQHLLSAIISILYFLFKGKALVIMRAKLDALKGIKTMLKLRHVEEQERIVPPQALIAAMQNGLLAPYGRRFR